MRTGDKYRGIPHKRHIKKIKRVCPICGSEVRVSNKFDDWWLYCPKSKYQIPGHIPQKYYKNIDDAIQHWNNNDY